MLKEKDYKKYKVDAFINPFLPKKYKKILMENYFKDFPNAKDYKDIEIGIKILKEFEFENYWEYMRIPYEVRKKLGFELDWISSSYEDLQKLKKIKEIHKKIYDKHKTKKNLNEKLIQAKKEINNYLIKYILDKAPKNKKELIIKTFYYGLIGFFIGLFLEILLKILFQNSINKIILFLLPSSFSLLFMFTYIAFLTFAARKPYRDYIKEKNRFEREMEKINTEFYKELKKEFPELIKD